MSKALSTTEEELTEMTWCSVWLEGKSPSYMVFRSLITTSFGIKRLTSSLSLYCSYNVVGFEGYSIMVHSVVHKGISQIFTPLTYTQSKTHTPTHPHKKPLEQREG